jgi:hypothetical protein
MRLPLTHREAWLLARMSFRVIDESNLLRIIGMDGCMGDMTRSMFAMRVVNRANSRQPWPGEYRISISNTSTIKYNYPTSFGLGTTYGTQASATYTPKKEPDEIASGTITIKEEP